LVYRLIESAKLVVQGALPMSGGLVWAGVLFGFYLARLGLGGCIRLIKDRFQEGLRGYIEERCYEKAQSLSLSALENPEFHDQLVRVRRGMDRRLFSTMSFLWSTVTG